MSIIKPISNYDEFIQLPKKLKKYKRNSINEIRTNIINPKFIITCIQNSSFKKISNNLGIYQKFYFNFYNNDDKIIYSNIHKNEVIFINNKNKNIHNHKLDKTNHKLDNLILINKEEEETQMNQDILIKENPKINNDDNKKKKLTEEEKLEEIFKNQVMINIVG
jgi:hypothetical protein